MFVYPAGIGERSEVGTDKVLFDESLIIHPVSAVAKAFQLNLFVPGSLPSHRVADVHCW